MTAPQLELKATPLDLASPATLDATRSLVSAAQSRSGDLVAASRDFRQVRGSSLPDSLRTAAWLREGSRWLEKKLHGLEGAQARDAGYLRALLEDDDGAIVPVVIALEEWGEEFDEKHAQIRLLLVRGGAIVHRLRPDLALFARSGAQAQAFLQDNLRIFLDRKLSHHGRVEAVANLSAAASDVATNGTIERRMGGMDGAPPVRHEVRVRT